MIFRSPVWQKSEELHLILRPFSTTAALPARAERPIFITWKISRAGTPRKLNVVLLSRVFASRQADKKCAGQTTQRKLSNVHSARAVKATAMENYLHGTLVVHAVVLFICRHTTIFSIISIGSRNEGKDQTIVGISPYWFFKIYENLLCFFIGV